MKNPEKPFDELSVDSDKNVYYSYKMKNMYKDGKAISEFIRIDKNLKRTNFVIYDIINDYEMSPAGDIWVLSGNKTLIHLDKKCKELGRITLTYGRDISIAPSGSVYVLDDNKVKLVYKNKLYIKYTLNLVYPYHEFHMIGEDNLVALNENSFEFINDKDKEVIVSDAAVKFCPYAVVDNKDNITILSINNTYQKDKNLKMYRIGKSGISFHNLSIDPGNYNMAIGYDGSIYIPLINNDKSEVTIYRIRSDYKVEKYVTLNTINFIGMQMDSKKNLYVLTNQSIFKVSPTKKIQGNDITEEKGGYSSTIRGFIKDKYNNLYIKYSKMNSDYRSQYSLLKINNNLDVKQIKLSSSDIYADLVFVTSKNEIAMINSDKKKVNQMYLLDLNGNVQRDTSYDGVSYYTPGLLSQIERIWKAFDGTIFYQRYREITKKTVSGEIWVADQAMADSYGTLYCTDYSNLYIYDTLLPKISSTNPAKGQNKIPLTNEITLHLSEPVRKGSDFSGISLSFNGSKVSVSCTLVENSIVITPKAKLKSKIKYTVNIPEKAVRDVAGNTLPDEYTYTFTTQ